MDVDDYQRAAARTLIDKPDFTLTSEHAIVATSVIMLAAKVGRALEYVKKGIFHQHGFDMDVFRALIQPVQVHEDDMIALDDDAVMMIWNTIGYIGEACEVAALVEQSILQGAPLDVAELGKEIGDGAWYPNALATRAGLRMSDVLAANLDKLRTRYPNGYSAADSVARVDVTEPVPGDPVANPCVSSGTVLCWCADDSPIDCPAYMANFTFDGKVLLSTNPNEPVLGDAAPIFTGAKAGTQPLDKLTTIIGDHHLRIVSAERVAIDHPLCGATKPDHHCGINAEPCDLLCGAYICSACAQEGYTTCANCCAQGIE